MSENIKTEVETYFSILNKKGKTIKIELPSSILIHPPYEGATR